MVSRRIHALIDQSKSVPHLLQLHTLILKSALDYDDNFVNQTVLSACSISVNCAKIIFDHIPIVPPLFAWNSIIKAFAKSSYPVESVKLFCKLRSSGLQPNNFTYPFVLKACGCCSLMGFDSDQYIGNTLLKMYVDCGAIKFARKVFDEMTVRDVVSWTSMIAAYIAYNSPSDALNVFQEMRLSNEKPNSVTLVSLLSACTHLLNICAGKSIHSYIIRNHIELDVALGTALFEMYSKCGLIEKALQIFNSMREKNLQSWTIMISALANHGRHKDAISLFTQMKNIGLQPDSLSFSVILSTCSHMGLVYEGKKYFDQMVTLYNIKPTVEHYGCMVDLLGRAGLMEEAYKVIKNMPMEPNAVILRSFLGACRNNGWFPSLDDKLLSKLEPELGTNYVLTANVFSLSGSWDDANNLRVAMKQKGLKKIPGCSWVDVPNCSTKRP
ncbi:pentatricopeptide repeat-containing protein [Senna tora]|uniref:Pentatricopeptide repeat-containing protein n=1 Tax=Senna tora TaxID=362788 RepID=A0A835CD13_9FABA|nr:pentatricopeptide repeat-containing protein [Senna tora]